MSYTALIQALDYEEKNNIADKPLLPEQLTDHSDEGREFNENTGANEITGKLFSTTDFINNVRKNSATKNKEYMDVSSNISAYGIAHDCIRSVIFNINNYPVDSYENTWLPVGFRAVMGTAVHDFLQSEAGDMFTENEACLKVPSRRFSGRLDCLSGNSVLVEIKSCAYPDYAKIISSGKPRPGDLTQVILYKYCLENHLAETKLQKPTRGGGIPKLDHYDIKYLTLLYVCHELVAADSPSLSEAKKFATNLKKHLQSKKNPFWFITAIHIDVEKEIDMVNEQIAFINKKWDMLNECLDSNTIPPMDNEFVKLSACFFCKFRKLCKQIP